ncbi:MAG: DUF1697 domain-containing protein [bacterium]
MARYAAFLRGMNLGKRRITNEDLCACFSALGCAQVSAFLASGNVVFESKLKDEAKVQALIEKGLKEALNYTVPTFLRSADEVCAIAAHQPFTEDQVKASRGKPQVGLLATSPGAAARKLVLSLSTTDDCLDIHGRELYWLPSGGILETGLDLKAIEKALGPMTVRTFNTMERLTAKHFT